MTRGFSLQTGPGVRVDDAMRRRIRYLRRLADEAERRADLYARLERSARSSMDDLRREADELDGGSE